MVAARPFLIIEDQRLVAASIARYLRPIGPSAFAATFAEGDEMLDAHSWAALIVDVSLPGGSGMDLLAKWRRRGNALSALIVTGHVNAELVNQAFDLGAEYVVKPVVGERLRAFAHRAVGSLDDREGRVRAALEAWRVRYQLTPAEMDVLRLSVDGATRDEVAAARGVTQETVKTHVGNLLEKTGRPSLHATVLDVLRGALSSSR